MSRVLVFDACMHVRWAARLHTPCCEAVERGRERGADVLCDPDEVDSELAALRDAGYDIDPCPCTEERT